MKKKIMFFVALSMLAAASPVLAAHNHGAQAPMDHGAPQAPVDDQNAKESEILISNCVKYISQIHQRVQKLQADIKEKHVGASVRDELKKLEQNLKEADVIARSLQIM